ncbi:MAG: hypothetical protein NWQ07_04070 [Flaviramulus sp.]|nr:hypothetical protein [Flaviramulus sp.]
MNIIIESTLQTLYKAQILLLNLTDEQLCNNTVSPYYSSIGSHIRHILDFYECLLCFNLENKIDLTVRSRNKDVESKCISAENYLTTIIRKLNNYNLDDNKTVVVVDDLGLGKIDIPYTLSALFAQANSHTIHHFAIINYILDSLGINLNQCSDFGYNPTTPRQTSIN